ncbi:MAG: outer membrane lipoprotein carrier protein LolA, partial [Gammaproteobacteria bacterium]|nr:outer membrane lipoprotein carrier protein LolA [Gammaproteobacteria bacterium]
MKVLCAVCAALYLLAAGAAHAATTPRVPAAFSARFVETRTLPGFDTPLISHGVLSVDATHGFRWEITAPYHYLFEMNGAQAREQLPDGSVRQLDPEQAPWLAAVEQIFVSALSGNMAQLQRYFDVHLQPLARGRQITLTPRPGPGPLSQAIARIQVVESAPGRPEQIDIRETSGGSLQLRFTPTGPPPT